MDTREVEYICRVDLEHEVRVGHALWIYDKSSECLRRYTIIQYPNASLIDGGETMEVIEDFFPSCVKPGELDHNDTGLSDLDDADDKEDNDDW